MFILPLKSFPQWWNRQDLSLIPRPSPLAFVACSTNAGEGLVKLSHVQWRTWMCGGVAHSFCTAVKQLSEPKKCQQDCLMSSAQPFYSPCLRLGLLVVLLGMCHSSTCPGTSLHVTQFYQAFPQCMWQALGWESLGTRLARPYLSQVPCDQWDRWVNVPSKGWHEGNPFSLGQGWVYPEGQKNPCYQRHFSDCQNRCFTCIEPCKWTDYQMIKQCCIGVDMPMQLVTWS